MNQHFERNEQGVMISLYMPDTIHNQSLILVRGVPGSGKSTIASMIHGHYGYSNSVHYETDMFMVDNDGKYKYNMSRLQECHRMCQEETKKALQAGYTVIISNTFTRAWEMLPYLNMAKELRIPVQTILCDSNYKNIHNVPEESLAKMAARMEYVDLKPFNHETN